ncbi:hypothetical protein G6011_09422 [Alternaria panax]|uniref:Heterokaryon incompatibility domain-containing protein n=1 Tax=Alternaria panax TaxID=48097 RepID=A0AAD4NPZ6_9PLEO|nr:hypothetical protein G6011_09422 [Alternaria panax]
MPKILLNVDTLRLVHGPSCEGDKRYAALSHCWGAAGTLATTLKATVESFKTGLDLHYLPQNFRDAIYATRQLGLTLLWVDALCIVQDDDASRSLDIGNMGSYYRNAFVTLSILSAHDSHVGFLKPRESASTISLGENLHLRRARPSWNEVLREFPLSKRAWVLQERLLSKRIVHFEKNEIFWECLGCSAREGSVEEEPEACGEGGSTNDTFKRCLSFANSTIVGELGRQTAQSELLMMQWYRILCQYSGLSLTYRSDVFLAIAGIAQLFRDITGFTYNAGLWNEHVHSGLLWYAEGSLMPVRPTTAASSVPSWSWASLDGPVSMIFSRESRTITTELTATTLESQLHFQRKIPDFVHTNHNVIALKAYCFNVICRSSSSGDAPYSDPYLRMVIDTFDERGVFIGTGYLDRIPESRTIRCRAVVVSQRVEAKFSSTPISYFLLVKESRRFPDTCYERIGVGQTADRIYGHVLDTLNITSGNKRNIFIV